MGRRTLRQTVRDGKPRFREHLAIVPCKLRDRLQGGDYELHVEERALDDVCETIMRELERGVG